MSLAKRRRVGAIPRTEHKVHITATHGSSININGYQVLKSWDITACPRSSTNARDARTGEEIYVHGFRIKFYMEIRNKPIYRQLIFLRCWVVSRIGSDENCIPLDTETDPIVQTNFYRGQQDNRAVDADLVNRSGWGQYTHSINTDAYNVLAFKQFWIDPRCVSDNSDTTFKSGFGNAHALFDRWIPLGRKVTYDGDSPVTIPTNGRVFFVWHMDNLARPNGGTSDQAPGSQVRMGFHSLMYFKDLN